MTAKKYGAQGECPECKSTNLDWNDSETYDNSIGYSFTCENCGHEDEELYNLEFAGFKSEYLSRREKQLNNKECEA